jgi:hypothetical protein
MYLRFARRRKDGKEHRYWSIVESRRCAGGRVVQRPLLYLGEINDGQREAWCHQIEAFDEASGRHRQLALFSAEQAVPDHARGFGVQVRLDGIPRSSPNPTFPTGALILEFCRRKLNLFKGRWGGNVCSEDPPSFGLLVCA